MPRDFNPEDELFLDHMAALTLQWPETFCFDCLVIVLGEDWMDRVKFIHGGDRSDTTRWLVERARAMFSGRRRRTTCFDQQLTESGYKPFLF